MLTANFLGFLRELCIAQEETAKEQTKNIVLYKVSLKHGEDEKAESREDLALQLMRMKISVHHCPFGK